MTIAHEALMDRLIERQALIVHFSGWADMRPDSPWPDDLVRAADNIEDWNLSCSLVWPERCQTTGSVGLILKPRTADSIVSAKVTDSASSTILGEEVSDGKPLSSELLDEIFAAPGDDYNELRVGRSDVLGWFVSLQSAPVVRLRSPAVLVDGVMVEAGILPQLILLGEIIRQAGDLPVFVFHQGQICQVTVDPEAFAPVSAASLYA